MRVVNGLDELLLLKGTEVGVSDWIEVTQEMVNRFADATGDRQWIHLDVERAKRESPFGGPVAHGFLTLSLLPSLMPTIVSVTGVKMGVNYGLNRVRFTAPVPVGKRVRIRATSVDVLVEQGGTNNALQSVHLTWAVTFEAEGLAKPVCIAEALSKLYF